MFSKKKLFNTLSVALVAVATTMSNSWFSTVLFGESEIPECLIEE